MNYAALDACVRELRREMIDFMTELVAIPSENPPGAAYPECVHAIQSRLRALDMPCEIIRYRLRRGIRDDSGAAVVLSNVGTGARTLYFSGHYDVVPVTTPDQCAPVLRATASSDVDRRT
jgi:succinyl-diaminopimelate desuccinylase